MVYIHVRVHILVLLSLMQDLPGYLRLLNPSEINRLDLLLLIRMYGFVSLPTLIVNLCSTSQHNSLRCSGP